MSIIKTQILKLVKALSADTDVKQGWDADLPKHAELDLGGPVLVVARCERSYILSLVLHGTVRSTLISEAFTDSDVSHAAAFFNESGGARSSGRVASHEQQQSTLADIGGRRTEQGVRDPNAPPGFEDEHLLGRPQPSGPSIQFDPENDIFPPGGRHPQLRPFDPLASGGSSGMTPLPFGSSKPPNIREDPTFPFGSGSGGYGPGPGSGPFGL